MPGESAWPTSYDYNWCENTAQAQTKTGPQVTRASAKTNRPTSAPTVYATHTACPPTLYYRIITLCLMSHSYTHAHMWRSWSTKVSVPHGECFLGLGFTQHTPALCSTHCSSGNVFLPNPRTLDEYTPHQYWSAHFIPYYYPLFNIIAA